jgi:hypothetical protein
MSKFKKRLKKLEEQAAILKESLASKQEKRSYWWDYKILDPSKPVEPISESEREFLERVRLAIEDMEQSAIRESLSRSDFRLDDGSGYKAEKEDTEFDPEARVRIREALQDVEEYAIRKRVETSHDSEDGQSNKNENERTAKGPSQETKIPDESSG